MSSKTPKTVEQIWIRLDRDVDYRYTGSQRLCFMPEIITKSIRQEVKPWGIASQVIQKREANTEIYYFHARACS